MPTSFRDYNPDQSEMFPPSPKDWLPAGHLSYFISDMVERLEAQDLVMKHPDPNDRRRVFLKLTVRAERKLAALSAVHRDELRRRSGTLGLLLAAIRQ